MLHTLVQKSAFVALWLFVFAIPWERSVVIPGLGGAGSLLGLVAIFLGFLSIFGRGRLGLRAPSVFLVVMGGFVLWSAASIFWSLDPGRAIGRTITYVQLLVVVWLIWQLCNSHERHLALIQAYVLGAYVSLVSVLISFALGSPLEAERYSGLDSNPNWLAIAIAIGIPMAWHLSTLRRADLRFWLNLAYVPLAVLAIGLTASRGGFLASLVALSLIPLTYGGLVVWRKVFLFALLAGALYGAFTLLPEANIQRLAETSSEISEGDLTSRRFIWEAGLSAFDERPLRGFGSGNFPEVIEGTLGYAKSPHNAFVSVLVELGLIGVALFVSLLLLAVAPMLSSAPHRAFYVVLWLTLLVGMLPANWEYHKATWFVVALLTTHRAYTFGSVGRTAERANVPVHTPKNPSLGRF